jgi:type VI secretion system protein ImpA
VLAQALASAAEQAEGGTAPEAAGQDGQPAAPGSAPVRGTPGTIVTREDVLKSLDRACEWLEKNEPTNPAPLLIRRAQRLMGKNFLEIIRDLAPAGIDQIENIAGTHNE